MIKNSVKNNHDPLGALYPQEYISEGDSPAFFYVMNNGLRNFENPTYGGWGGRFEKMPLYNNVYIDAVDDGNKLKSMRMWIDAVNKDFEARMDWCVADQFKDANHPPKVQLNRPLLIKFKSGKKVVLSAKGTTDPDGNQLTYRWWQYRGAGSYKGNVQIQNVGNQDASCNIPGDARKGETIHIICEVKGNGTPQLTRYQRVVIEVK